MSEETRDPRMEARKLRAKGVLNEAVGKATHDERRAAEGRTQQTLAGVRDYMATLSEREEERTERNLDDD